ncbi:hypothetical protein RclHR1_00720012 [Rhizophagus clarus]|uniref:Uncharacterized protein n=1 Tax=Rhizophagus clarus TaxID=94130 RepID=A0A2Z6S1V0_9GLOM|nr:hypothetical protein RclHR1_00720012 [Rhizophagus clarus]
MPSKRVTELLRSSTIESTTLAPVPPELPKPSESPVPEEEPEADSEGDSDYETADEGDTLDSESESETDNEFEPEEDKILFRRIENPALKRLVETRRISDECLCVDHLAIIPETYQYREDLLAMFEDIEDQISDVYRRELARLGGIKIKIVLIAHMYQFVQGGCFGHRIDQDIAFPSEILNIIHQDRIDQTVSRQYNEILDKIDEMERNQHSGWIYKYEIKIFLEISAYQPLRGRSHFALPKIWSKPQLGIINPQNTDERCFEACLKAYLASEEVRKEGRRARNLHDISRLRRFDNILDFSGINFPVTLRDIDIFEENNLSFSVNVFYPAPSKNDKEQATRKLDPLHISEYNYQREHLVDLILFTEGEEDLRDRRNINDIPEGLNTHYCLINGESGCQIYWPKPLEINFLQIKDADDVATIYCKIGGLEIPCAMIDTGSDSSIFSDNIAELVEELLGIKINRKKIHTLNGVASKSLSIGTMEDIPITIGSEENTATITNEFSVVPAEKDQNGNAKSLVILGTQWQYRAGWEPLIKGEFKATSNGKTITIPLSVHKSQRNIFTVGKQPEPVKKN